MDYTLSGPTLTFTSAPPLGTGNILCRWISPYAGGVPEDGSVTAAKFAPGAVESVLAPRIGSTGPAGCRNLIRNPKFTINQRNVSGTVTLSAGAYGHDGWKAGASGCTYTFSTTQNRTTLTITAGSLVQTVDGLDLAAGVNTHTLSWGGTCQGKIGAGSYGASGVTGSATGGTNINVEFGTGTLYEPQFERGTVASEFDCLSYMDELDRCKLYLPSAQAIGYTGDARMVTGGFVASSNQFLAVVPFGKKLRGRPTGISTSGSFKVWDGATTAEASSLSFYVGTSETHGIVTVTCASAIAAGRGGLLYATVTGVLSQILFTGLEI